MKLTVHCSARLYLVSYERALSHLAESKLYLHPSSNMKHEAVSCELSRDLVDNSTIRK